MLCGIPYPHLNRPGCLDSSPINPDRPESVPLSRCPDRPLATLPGIRYGLCDRRGADVARLGLPIARFPPSACATGGVVELATGGGADERPGRFKAKAPRPGRVRTKGPWGQREQSDGTCAD